MSTIRLPDQQATDLAIAGTVSTAPVYTKSLPDHVPHISFHIDTADGPGCHIHADGTLAELARVTVHRHARVTVIPKRFYKLSPDQITPDVDAESIDLEFS